MNPTLSTRLLRPVANNGWSALKNTYRGIRYDNGSLGDQYYCHFEAFIASNWDIEEGRPNVGLINTILEACNPK